MRPTIVSDRTRSMGAAGVLLPALCLLIAGALHPLTAQAADATAVPGATLSFAPVVKKVIPSVVTIFTSRTIKRQVVLPPGLQDDPTLRYFFGFGNGGPAPQEPAYHEQGLGSGVIVSKDGYILTNNHVVANADEIKVRVAGDDDDFVAKVVGTDDKTDLAVLRIKDGDDLHPVTFGNSDQAQVGDIVLAVGDPFGVGETVTMGIISARGRGVGLADYEDFLQTDASINPGNSGGALVDAQGRLIGINTAILSPNGGGNLGIGFAVPVNIAHAIMESIITKGKVVRGYLGLMIQPVTNEMSRAMHLAKRGGALVGDVVDGSPAAKAGLEPGDVVTAFGGTEIQDPRHLRLLASETAPGTKVEIAYNRNGKAARTSVVLGDLAGDGKSAGGPGGTRTDGKPHVRLGVRLRDLDPDTRDHLEIPAHVTGALVIEVMPGSRAEAAGLKADDVIMEVDRKTVHSAAAASEAISAAHGDLLLRVWSRHGIGYVAIDLSSK